MKIINLLFIVLLPIVLLAAPATRVSQIIPTIPNPQNEINTHILQLQEAEKNSASIIEYKVHEKNIITSFESTRKRVLQALKAKEVIRCKAYATTPSIWTGGRRGNSCKISSNTNYFRGWKVSSYVDSVPSRTEIHEGGTTSGGSTKSGNRVTLKTTCRTVHARDHHISGSCLLILSTTITYKMNPQTIQNIVDSEVGKLLRSIHR